MLESDFKTVITRRCTAQYNQIPISKDLERRQITRHIKKFLAAGKQIEELDITARAHIEPGISQSYNNAQKKDKSSYTSDIEEYIKKHPGVSSAKLAENMKISPPVARYFIKILVENGQVYRTDDRPGKLYFGEQQKDMRTKILDFVSSENRAVTCSEVADKIGTSKTTASKHLRALERGKKIHAFNKSPKLYALKGYKAP